MVNLLKISNQNIIDIILDEDYFSIYDLNANMFDEYATDYEDCMLVYEPILPTVVVATDSDAHLYYDTDLEREWFLRMLYDRHRYFNSACVDFSGRNHLMYILHDISISVCDSLVELVRHHIITKYETTSSLLKGMRSFEYYFRS